MPMRGRPIKYSGLAGDEGVKRWLANLARGSPITAEVALRRLGKACELLGMTPLEILSKARRDPMKLQDAFEDFVNGLESRGKAPGYVDGFLKTIKSWLRYNDVVLGRRIKIRNAAATPTIENEQIPSQEELLRIFRASPPRVRAAEALMALADLRPMVMGNHYGSDGLTLGDLPELRVSGGEAAFERIPAIVVVRAPLSKAGHKYFTFLPGEGCICLNEYLEGRLRSGEKLGPQSPLIGYERPRATTKRFMHTSKISHLIRTYMRRAGVRKRPYVLRAYAETQLIIAESKWAISHPYLQFVAGHKGDIEARYSTNKGRLPPNMIEDMREAYKRCEPFLGTSAKPLEQTSVAKEAQKEALKSMAKNVFGIDILDVKIAREKELGRGLEPDEEIELLESEMKRFREREPQRIVKGGRSPPGRVLVRKL